MRADSQQYGLTSSLSCLIVIIKLLNIFKFSRTLYIYYIIFFLKNQIEIFHTRKRSIISSSILIRIKQILWLFLVTIYENSTRRVHIICPKISKPTFHFVERAGGSQRVQGALLHEIVFVKSTLNCLTPWRLNWILLPSPSIYFSSYSAEVVENLFGVRCWSRTSSAWLMGPAT